MHLWFIFTSYASLKDTLFDSFRNFVCDSFLARDFPLHYVYADKVLEFGSMYDIKGSGSQRC